MTLWRRIKYNCTFTNVKLVICVLTPFLLSPLAFSSYKESRCGFVFLWMAIFWMMEPVSINVTALLPVALLPVLGIVDAHDVAPNYMKDVLMMFFGGLGVAIAVEHCNLHERIALKVLSTVGANIKWMMLGFMSTTMFLSMWISNSATSAMMVPIINAVMAELERETEEGALKQDLGVMHKTLLICVAYSANLGGTGTITGTSPNMIFKGYMEEMYPDSQEITYASWMAYNIPAMIVCVLFSWIVLQIIYVPCWRTEDQKTKDQIKTVIRSKYMELGRITFHEVAVLSLFILLVILWFFREPKFMSGWSDLLASDAKIGDSAPALAIFILMFLLPAEPWKFHKSKPLLTWDVVHEKMPWGLILLLGGGYALADGAEKSGLSKWLGEEIAVLSQIPPSAVLTIMWIVSTLLTEIMSNSATCTIMIPVVNRMALTSQINPLYLMLPVSIIASHAFILPVATGPNAIIFGTGKLKTTDMMIPGIIMNLLAGFVQLFMVHTLGILLFNITSYPSWAPQNVTLIKTM